MPDEKKQEMEEIEAEIIPSPASIIPWDQPSTVDRLSIYGDRGAEVIEALGTVVDSLRTISIRLTSPSDWLLFRTREGVVTAYLQDSGCQRVRDVWRIAIIPSGPPERIPAGDEFAYSIHGEGRCGITGQEIHDQEGIRYSTDDFSQRKPAGIEREVATRKAARANLDGTIVRQLTGLKSVPVEELTRAWQGTNKKTDQCAKGKGFGTRAEREGQTVHSQGQPEGAGPICEKCGKTMIYRSAGEKDGKKWAAYWKCPEYAKGNGHSAQNAASMPESRDPGMEG